LIEVIAFTKWAISGFFPQFFDIKKQLANFPIKLAGLVKFTLEKQKNMGLHVMLVL
jgi:hypothetical protein